jgi:hypothetical protein
MARVKEDAPKVWLDCCQCGEQFSQPDGAVTSQTCDECLRAMARAFWTACSGLDEDQQAKAASELLRAVYGDGTRPSYWRAYEAVRGAGVVTGED